MNAPEQCVVSGLSGAIDPRFFLVNRDLLSTDFDGEPRPAPTTRPDIGADEYTP